MTKYAGILKLEAFRSAKLCVKGGIENGPMTENGHKMAIIDHFCCLIRVLSAKNGFFVKKYMKINGKTISIIIRDWFVLDSKLNIDTMNLFPAF